jgi:pimeloyl-ACP methyl ester carboxylesterase
VHPLLGHQVLGSGPDTVVLVHGVGVGAPAFGPVATILAATHMVVVVDRRGYGGSVHLTPPPDLDTQIDDLAVVVDHLADSTGSPPAVVGVSGGATLTLALGLRRARTGETATLGPLVVHEPLVGPLAPSLALRVQDGYRTTLAVDPGLATRYVAELVGPTTWDALGDAARAAVADRASVVAAEVPQFLAFAPRADELASLRGHHVVASIGDGSPSAREEANDVLVTLAGATRMVVPDAGHLPQVDNPGVFADLLRHALSPTPEQALT